MLGVYSVQQHKVIATWNSTRDLWETGQDTIFGPSAVFSETWPTSGMTRNGTAYELPTSEHHTADSESSSLLPTPVAGQGASLRTSEGFNDLGRTIYKLLPTPLTQDNASGPSMMYRNTLELRALDQVSPAHHAALAALPPEQRGELMNQLSEDGSALLADLRQSQPSQPDATGSHNSAQSTLNGSWDSNKAV